MMFSYRAKVIKVIDGDTVDLNVDLGFHCEIGIRTRLLGINAPEVSTAEGKQVRDWLRERLPIGDAVTVDTFKDPGDKYGRWLARINSRGEDICSVLVAHGYAVPM